MSGTVPARLYLASNAAFRAAQGGLQALFEGFWLGMLPTSAIDAVSQLSYGSGTGYSNDHHLDSGFHFWEDLAIRRYFPAAGRVLVAAAGGGREIIALARAGFHADGFECSRPMVEAGQRGLRTRQIDARLEWSPPCTVPQTLQTYGSLIAGWNGYTYILPRHRRITFLRNLGRHVQAGGHMLISGALRPSKSRPEIWIPRIANVFRRCTFRPPEFETGDRFQGRPRHIFTRAQVCAELAEAGFTLVEFWCWGQYWAAIAVYDLPSSTPSQQSS